MGALSTIGGFMIGFFGSEMLIIATGLLPPIMPTAVAVVGLGAGIVISYVGWPRH